ncbi:MAG: hydantoinase/oxoprolinase family protein [Actinomycetota bacterium]|nr:hydantoinase/oxoprolinase family protein [Actinomycetota bacterium]
MSFRIAVDTGGTFTDVVVTDDEGGALWVSKAPTTPQRVFDGISEALRYGAADHGLTLEHLLGEASVFVYGTTQATNAILTATTARTAFLTTAGHPDTLVLREGGKLNPFDFRHPYPAPYVPRRLTFEVRERVNSEGEVTIALDETALLATLGELRRRDVAAVAVCLLWSIVNPVHEERIGELLPQELPGVPFTLSHRLNPIIREYRRASSTAIDASLKPLMQGHLDEMAADLRAAGFTGEVLVGTSFGGVLGVEDVAARPVYSVNSAPAMAPVAGRVYAPEERSVIVCDMGGTSFDVSLVRDGYIKFTRETWLGGQFTGHMTGLSAVDIKNIGAGGGSIAWIDSGGLLRVGPQSAGAQPGPACYGAGGTEPTVTDAAVLLGYIDPNYFLGGRMRLSEQTAREVVEREVAEPLGIDVDSAAHAILTIANEHMVGAIRDITINEGLDPRGSLVLAGGGAGGMTIGRIAEELGCDRVLVPRTAGTLSACGGLFSDIVTEFSVSQRADTNRFDYAAVNRGLARLSEQIDEFFGRLGTPPELRSSEFFVEARYPYQVWELEVPLAAGRFEGPEDVEAMIDGFHHVHERVFAVSEPGQYIECIYWKGRATALLRKPGLALAATDGTHLPEPVAVRRASFGAQGALDTPCFQGESLSAGHRVAGPGIILEPTTTVVVYPGWAAAVTETGDYLLTRER